MSIIGFTASREGLTKPQKKSLEELVYELQPEEVHHGDCVGGDEEFHDIARILGCNIVVHPPKDDEYRAFCHGDEILPEEDYLKRDDDIVKESDRLIACPKGFKEKLRSGTWTTVRYARKYGKNITIIYPDGSFDDGEN